MFSLENITYTLPQSKVPFFKNLSLHIPQGSLLAIMGLNGSGKTTLIRILSSYLKPESGSVLIQGKSIKDYTAKKMAQMVAFVPQEFPTQFPFTVLEFVMMGRFAWQKNLLSQETDSQKTNEVLNTLNLEKLKYREVSTLSGGEKQRVLMARAILQNTSAIILDEPFNHLDIKNKQEILQIIKAEHKENNKTIIAVMHDFIDVKNYFKDVLFLKNGGVTFHGQIKEGLVPTTLKDVFEVTVCCP